MMTYLPSAQAAVGLLAGFLPYLLIYLALSDGYGEFEWPSFNNPVTARKFYLLVVVLSIIHIVITCTLAYWLHDVPVWRQFVIMVIIQPIVYLGAFMIYALAHKP